MRVLLDTHVALWAVVQPDRLSASARAQMSDPANSFFVSAVSVWEIAIKRAIKRKGREAISISADEALAEFRRAGMALLPMTAEHASVVENLPLLHADPFDRILVAQALSEPLRLMTHDKRVAAYIDTSILV